MLGNFISCCLPSALSSCDAQLSSIIIGQWLKFCDCLHTRVPVWGFKRLGKHSQSDFFLNLFNCMCMAVLLAVYLCATCMQCPWRPEDGIISPGSRVTGSCGCHLVLGIKHTSSGRAARALKTTEPSLQPIGPDIFLWLHSGIVWQLGVTLVRPF